MSNFTKKNASLLEELLDLMGLEPKTPDDLVVLTIKLHALIGCIENRTRSLGLTPVDWTSHPFRKTFSPENTPLFAIYIVDAGS